MSKKRDPEGVVREIKRKIRRRSSAEEKIRIFLEGLKGEDTIAGLCRREGISPNLYHNWRKEFLEAGQQRLMGNTKCQAEGTEVTELRRENDQLKHLMADLSLRNVVLKKKLSWLGERVGRAVRCSQSEKMEIIRLVEQWTLGVERTLAEFGFSRGTFYR